MSTTLPIYKYPKLRARFESKLKAHFETETKLKVSREFRYYCNLYNYTIIPEYLNPHANITKHFRTKRYDKTFLFYLSMHPSSDAIDKMMESPYFCVNVDGLILNTNPNIGPLLELSFEYNKFNSHHWKWMCTYSSNPAVMEFLNNHIDKIDWKSLSANPSAIEIIKRNLDKIDYISISANTHPEAISILERNLDLYFDDFCWLRISANPSAIEIIKRNLDKINYFAICTNTNPEAISILETIIDGLIQNRNIPSATQDISHIDLLLNLISWRSLSENPAAISLLEKYADNVVPHELLKNPNAMNILFDLDYQAMSKARTKLLQDELMEQAFHPSRVSKRLDYYCENGGDLADFEMLY